MQKAHKVVPLKQAQEVIKRLSKTEDGQVFLRALHDECYWGVLAVPDTVENAKALLSIQYIYNKFRDLIDPLDILEIEHAIKIQYNVNKEGKHE